MGYIDRLTDGHPDMSKTQCQRPSSIHNEYHTKLNTVINT